MSEVKTPKGNEERALEGKETCSSAPNTGQKVEAQPTFDAGIDSGVGHCAGDGSSTRFEKE